MNARDKGKTPPKGKPDPKSANTAPLWRPKCDGKWACRSVGKMYK